MSFTTTKPNDTLTAKHAITMQITNALKKWKHIFTNSKKPIEEKVKKNNP